MRKEEESKRKREERAVEEGKREGGMRGEGGVEEEG